ncbi:MAG: hypothetical protein RR517_20100 [Pseudomonas sp.]
MKRRQRVYPVAYYLGRICRDNDKSREAQPYALMTVNCGWWLAGWHDSDMELTHETQTNGPAAPPAAGTLSLAA